MNAVVGIPKQLLLDVHKKIIVDLFAGAGGMSVAFENAFGRSPDIAINHNEDALSMHRKNHPLTKHYIADVYEVCPHLATQGRPVGWLHLSPDCTHHSQASGGQPRDKKIRGLSWVGYRWAGQVLPDIISLENVKQILSWSPLVAKRDKETGRVVTLDLIELPDGKKANRIADPGEQVPVHRQYLVPDKKRKGASWRKFVRALEGLGYVVEHRNLVAADYGGHTTRERLFMIARRDGQPIVWPKPTHFKNPKKGQLKWKPASDCIDFSDLGNSIFERNKELAKSTKRRIAKGMKRYVIDAIKPFIVPIAHYNGTDTVHSIDDPFRTIVASTQGSEFSIATPIVTKCRFESADREVAAAYMMQANDGFNTSIGREMTEPVSTITNTGSQQQLVSAFMSSYYTGESDRSGSAADPFGTKTTENQISLSECALSPEDEASALRVAAFLMEYYSEGGQWSELDKPLNTITTKDRLALVTVFIQGTSYVITDIRLRMLKPRELFSGQDFPKSYITEYGHDGRKFSITKQVHMCGNSVDPAMATPFLLENAPWLAVRKAAA